MQSVRLPRAGAFAGAFGLVLLYALRGGAYDVVVRGEHAVAVAWLLALGLAIGLLPLRRPAWRALAPLLGLGLLALLTVLALSSTPSQERTGIELARVLHHGLIYVLPLVFLGRRTWTAAAAGLAAGVLAVCFLAVGARLAPDLFGRDVVAQAFGVNRLSHPLGYWNAVGAWAAMAMVLGVVWSAHARTWPVRALALAAVPVAVACGYLTYSRAAIGSVVLGLLIAVLLSRHRLTVVLHALLGAAGGGFAVLAIRGEPAVAQGTGTEGRGAILLALLAAGLVLGAVAALTRWRGKALETRLPRPVRRGAAGAAALVAVVVAVAFGPGAVSSAYESFNRTSDPNLNAGANSDLAQRFTTLSGTRRLVWENALDAYRSEPVSGIGPGTFSFYWDQHGRGGEFVRDAHSLYLENLAELGWPGLLAILLLLGAAAWAALSPRLKTRSGREAGALAAAGATLAIFALSAGVDWIWESTANTALALGTAGTAAAALGRPRVRRPARRGPALALRVGLVIAALVVLLVQLPGMVGTSTVRASQTATRQGDLEAAFARAQDAIAVQPWAATPYAQRALVLERQGRLVAARADLRRAIAREPQEWTHRLLLARVEAERGRTRAALRAFRQARRLRPKARLFRGLAPPRR